jgi:hypothetical protein
VGPEQVRYAAGRPVAISGVLVPTSATSFRTTDIPLGTPTCSARSRRGTWALYGTGSQAVVVNPGGALIGEPSALAALLPRLLEDRRTTAIDRAAVRALGELLTSEVQPAPTAAYQPRSMVTGASRQSRSDNEVARDGAQTLAQIRAVGGARPRKTRTVRPVTPDETVSRRAA